VTVVLGTPAIATAPGYSTDGPVVLPSPAPSSAVQAAGGNCRSVHNTPKFPTGRWLLTRAAPRHELLPAAGGRACARAVFLSSRELTSRAWTGPLHGCRLDGVPGLSRSSQF